MNGHDLRQALAQGHARRKRAAAADLLMSATAQCNPTPSPEHPLNPEYGFLHAFNALLVEAVKQGVSRERIERCCAMRVRPEGHPDRHVFAPSHVELCWTSLVRASETET